MTDSERKIRETFRELLDHLDMSGIFSNLLGYIGLNYETLGAKMSTIRLTELKI